MKSTDSLPFVSIIVINYQGERHLNNCLQALRVQTYPRHLYEVIVLDNNSNDRSILLLRQQHIWCHILPMRQNYGFAQGNNIAAIAAHGTWLLLLNNDTIADPYLLFELFRNSGDNPAAIVAKLVFTHDPSILNSTGSYLLRDGRGTDRGYRQLDQGKYERYSPVFAGCGAAIAIRADGPIQPIFEPSYFVYYEDTLHCSLLRHRHQNVHYQPRAVVRHTHGAAAGDRSSLFHYYVERNRALTALRCGDFPLAIYTFMILSAKVCRSYIMIRKQPNLVRTLTASLASYLVQAPLQLLKRFRFIHYHKGAI